MPFKYRNVAYKLLRKAYQIYIYPERLRINKNIVAMPRLRLKQRNIENCATVLNRLELIKLMPRRGRVAELGVDNGNYSEIILKYNQPKELYLIDIWNSPNYPEEKYKSVRNKFKDKVVAKQVFINRNLTTLAFKDYEDGYFDWIYIDTDHSYQTTLDELYCWKDKVKKNGFILGHDYVTGSFRDGHKYGVMEAVTEFCLKEDYSIVYITMDYVENNSFALKKN